MDRKRLTYKVWVVAALLFFLQAGRFSVYAASYDDAVKEAKNFYQQAIELHGQGDDVGATRLAKQALKSFKGAYKDRKIVDSIEQFSKQLEKMEKIPGGAVSMYLVCLQTYLSDQNLKRFETAEKMGAVDERSTRYKTRKRSPGRSAQDITKEVEKAQKLHEQAKILHAQGDYDGTIALSQQALEIYDQIRDYRDARRQVRQNTKMVKYYIAKDEIANAASTYLLCLKIYENEAKAQVVYAKRKASENDVLKQQIKEMAQAKYKDILLGKVDKEAFQKQVLDMANIPKRTAMELEKTSHLTDILYEYIDPARDYQRAFNHFLNVLSGDQMIISNVINFIPEKEKLDFVTTKQNNLNAFLSLVINKPDLDPVSRKKAFDIWITRKGMLLEAQRRFQQALIDSGDKEAVKTFQELNQIRGKISNLLFPKPAKDETSQQRIVELERKKAELEDKLCRTSQAYASQKKIEAADTGKISERLPARSALLDFARIRVRDFKGKKWLAGHYMAFLLHAGKDKEPVVIDLGDAQKIDKAINRFKRQIEDESDIRNKGLRLEKTSKRLYSLVFSPLLDALSGVKRIYISPDGNLNLIPFEVLLDTKGNYLIDQYSFDYLAASRDILGFGRPTGTAGQSVIIGNPDFDLAGNNKKLKKQDDSSAGGGKIPTRSGGMRAMQFSSLPHTLEEINALQSVLGLKNAAVYKNKTASEASLFSHRSPRILHLATHGFFLKDQDLDALSGTDSEKSKEDFEKESEKITIYENPLLRSGIALAGANTTLRAHALNSQGIVTSEKILGLKLQGTEMVVLSACQTGLGEVTAGEGVFGLRRAFLQAGAKSLVMSMWKVPDKETCELMVQFYKNIAAGTNRSQALRQAVLRQKQIAGERYGFAHPIFWGAFVFLGEF